MTKFSDFPPDQMKVITDNWTTDELGLAVIWNKPPFRDETTGRLSLRLPGEPVGILDTPEIHHKRMTEYYLLVERDSS